MHNLCVCVCVCVCMFSFLLGIYLRVALLDYMVTLCLIFSGPAKLFPKVAILLYNLTSQV